MFQIHRSALYALLFTFLFSSFTVFASDKRPKEANKEKTENVDFTAKSVDFNAELQSSSSSLKTLGVLIEDARKNAEVNTLISAALTLFLEEAAAKKTARISGKDLLHEAAELAITQKNITSLRQIVSLYENASFGNDTKRASELKETISNIEKDLASTRGPGAKVVDVKVENYSAYTIYVYIDGVYKGYISPGYYVVYNNIGLGWTDMYAETDNMWSESQGKYIYYYWSNSYNLTDYDYTYDADFTWSIY